MRKTLSLISCICLFQLAHAQKQLFVSAAKPVFETPNKQAAEKGILVRQAAVSIQRELPKYYEVLLDNGEIGYIFKDHLSQSLYASDAHPPSPSPIIDEDEFYGAPHLFTQAAGLKIRARPDATSPQLGTLLNGTAVPISYYPFAADRWVNIGNFENSENSFVLQKFLGSRPVFEQLEKQLEALPATDLAQRSKTAERLLELGWNSTLDDQKKGLQHFLELSQLKKDTKAIAKTQLLLQYVEGALHPQSDERLEMLFNNPAQMGFVLRGKLEPAQGFSKSELEKVLGSASKPLIEFNECNSQQGDVYQEFSLGTVCLNTTNKIYALKMSRETAFHFLNYLYTENTSEKGFVETAQGYLNHFDPRTGTYGILAESGGFFFRFKAGLLDQVSMYYSC